MLSGTLAVSSKGLKKQKCFSDDSAYALLGMTSSASSFSGENCHGIGGRRKVVRRFIKSFTQVLWIYWIVTTASQGIAMDTDFYIVAHADDWQLFMGDRAYADAQANHRMVFVQLGAASDGRWPNWEEGNQLSIESLAGGNGVHLEVENCSWATVNRHTVCKRSYKNTVSYYFRLPIATHDTGEGFPISRYQTLERMRLGVNTVDSLGKNKADPISTYRSFADLVSTLASIVRSETHGSDMSSVTINAQDPDPDINPNDHKDHVTVGCAASIVARQTRARLNLYVDYQSLNFPQNLTAESVELKTRLYTVFNSKVGLGMSAHFAAWLRRTIFRTITDYPITDILLLLPPGEAIWKHKSLPNELLEKLIRFGKMKAAVIGGRFVDDHDEAYAAALAPRCGVAARVGVANAASTPSSLAMKAIR